MRNAFSFFGPSMTKIRKAMNKQEFDRLAEASGKVLEEIRTQAHELHASVNQHYDCVHPYGFHLDGVARWVREYGHEVCRQAADVLPLFFGAYYHDSIEDARLTYNDVMKRARAVPGMDEEQARTATEIVYALTNEKGRNRAERAGEKYYQGIRETPFAPFVKLADRLANVSYSCSHGNESNRHMKEVYRQELPHFLEAIAGTRAKDDVRFSLPSAMIERLRQCVDSGQE